MRTQRPGLRIGRPLGRAAALLIAMAGCIAVQAQQAARTAQAQAWTVPSSDDIRSMLAERMARNGVGTVIGVIEPAGRRIVAYGKSGAADGRPLNGDTVFQTGSCSKVFVSLVLADMVVRGEVKIDDPASKYLPAGVKMPQHGRPIALVDLSMHISGLPRMPTNFDLQAEPHPMEAYSVQQLYHFLSTYTPPRAPGTEPEYSNLGVSLLGRLLALRAGKEYEDLLKERVLLPLGMSSTSIHVSPDQLKRLAPGHDKDLLPAESPEMKTLAASGSVRTTPNDVLAFLAAYLGYVDTPLKQAMEYQLRFPRVPAESGPLRSYSPQQGLGWKFRLVSGREIGYIDGVKTGYRCAIAFDLERRTGIVVLANARTDDHPLYIARHLLTGERLLPIPPPVAVRKFAKIDSVLLDSYAGEYRVGADGVIRVARRNDHLLVESGGGPSEFYPEGPQDFGRRTESQQITFRRASDGSVTGLTWYPEGRNAGESQEAMRIRKTAP